MTDFLRKTGALCAMIAASAIAHAAPLYFDTVRGAGPHDVAASPAAGGPVYYTAQATGKLGILDPATGRVEEIALGPRSAPHGVIVGPDNAPWITDSGQNAIVRVDPKTREVRRYPLPEGSGYANLNTATFDRKGRIWFTGQSGIYGRVDPAKNEVKVWPAPRGRGPYGITTTPSGDVWYASLAGNHIAQVDVETGAATVVDPPTPDQGARRVWSDSRGHLWVSYWNTGHVGRYDPVSRTWREWGNAHAYSVWGEGHRVAPTGAHETRAGQCESLAPVQPRTRERAADAGTGRRGVGGGVRCRSAGDGSGALSGAGVRPTPGAFTMWRAVARGATLPALRMFQ